MSTKRRKIQSTLRRAHIYDVSDLVQIEEESFKDGWKKKHFLHCLENINNINIVAQYQYGIIGFAMCQLSENRLREKELQVCNFTIHPAWRRKGVGSQIIGRLIKDLFWYHWACITLEVRETNLPAQKFFSSQKFLAMDVLRRFYQDTDEDAYVMKYLPLA